MLQNNNSHDRVFASILILGITRDPVYCFWLTLSFGKEVCVWWGRDEDLEEAASWTGVFIQSC